MNSSRRHVYLGYVMHKTFPLSVLIYLHIWRRWHCGGNRYGLSTSPSQTRFDIQRLIDVLFCDAFRRVSRQSASINYIFAFCASLIVFFSTPIVHAQHNDLRRMIKATSSSVTKSRRVIMNFRDDSSTFILENRSIIFRLSLSSADGGNWAKEIKVNPAAESCSEALCEAIRRWSRQTTHCSRLMATPPQQKLFQLLLHDCERSKVSEIIQIITIPPKVPPRTKKLLCAQQVHHQKNISWWPAKCNRRRNPKSDIIKATVTENVYCSPKDEWKSAWTHDGFW